MIHCYQSPSKCSLSLQTHFPIILSAFWRSFGSPCSSFYQIWPKTWWILMLNGIERKGRSAKIVLCGHSTLLSRSCSMGLLVLPQSQKESERHCVLNAWGHRGSHNNAIKGTYKSGLAESLLIVVRMVGKCVQREDEYFDGDWW